MSVSVSTYIPVSPSTLPILYPSVTAILPALTWSFCDGLFVPMPTLPLWFIARARVSGVPSVAAPNPKLIKAFAPPVLFKLVRETLPEDEALYPKNAPRPTFAPPTCTAPS